jgi:cytochrome P450
VFADPHAYRIDRVGGAKHVAFGGGAHGCLGAGLARLDAKLAIEALFRAFPRLTLAEAPERKTTYGFRGYSRIPLASA